MHPGPLKNDRTELTTLNAACVALGVMDLDEEKEMVGVELEDIEAEVVGVTDDEMEAVGVMVDETLNVGVALRLGEAVSEGLGMAKY